MKSILKNTLGVPAKIQVVEIKESQSNTFGYEY